MGNTDRSFNPFKAIGQRVAEVFKPKPKATGQAMPYEERRRRRWYRRHSDFSRRLNKIHRMQNIYRYIQNGGDTTRLSERGYDLYLQAEKRYRVPSRT